MKSRNLVKHITPAVVTDKNPPIISPKPIHPALTPSPTAQSNANNNRIPSLIRPKMPVSKSSIGGGGGSGGGGGGGGGVSPWFPPSNSVFRSPSVLPKNYQTKPEDSASPPQALVNMNNKRYIVVPKNNVLSVASNQNQSPTKLEPSQSTTIITPTPTSTIIQGPPLQNNPFVQPAANSPGVVLVPFMSGENTEVNQQPFLVVNPSPGSSVIPNSSQADLPTESETTDHFQ